MATEEPVTQPLRISKTTPGQSPLKGGIPRPLSEISSTEKRRNSPSWNQATKKMALNTDSSPFQSSPLDSATSPRLFWQNRHANSNAENDLYGGRGASPSPTRRSSIERLQKASRVKNSTMFAREQKLEYDPTRLLKIERPLAKVQGNAFGGSGVAGFRAGHARSQSEPDTPRASPTKSPESPDTATQSPGTATQSPNAAAQSPKATTGLGLSRSPTKDQASPMKSSLSTHRFKSSCDSQNSDYSFEGAFEDGNDVPFGGSLRRHAKSVTFDAAPPQINEYEMATPDLSSVGTNSREGSYDSEEDDDDDDYDDYGLYPRGDADLQDDSFDASLEDTDKTPVVLPDDWRQDQDHRFSNSPMPESAPGQPTAVRPQHGRTDSSTSSEHRPLPPLPGTPLNRSHSVSSDGTTTTADRVLGSPRTLPSPPPASVTQSELQNIGNGQMSLEERLKLMMLDETSPKAEGAEKTFAEQQRERRMRRAGARDKPGTPTPEPEASEAEENSEADDTIGDISGLDMDYQLPSISRQSILNRVNGNRSLERESGFNFTSPPPDLSPARGNPYDPDVPIASIEDSIIEDITEPLEDSILTDRDINEDDKADVYDLYQRSDDDEGASKKDRRDDYDDESHYSDDEEEKQEIERPQTAFHDEDITSSTPRGSPAPKDTIRNFSATLPRVNESSTKNPEFSRSLQSYMLPKPKDAAAVTHTEGHKTPDAEACQQRPRTPEPRLAKPDYDGSGWGDPEEDEEPRTPESVIHHPISDDEEEDEEYEDEEVHEDARLEVHVEDHGEVREDDHEDEPLESPAVPEQVATIKASGSKLKTRASATPSDIASMREARRHVSREIVPSIPPIPDKHRDRLSRDAQGEDANGSIGGGFLDRHPSFKKKSLTLDLDLGLSLDQDFERVIEAQKVAFQQLSFTNQFLSASCSPSRQVSVSKLMVATDDARTSNNAKEPGLNANITARKQRGYLMRQNTKVVTATDRPGSGDNKASEDVIDGTRSAGNSPVKSRPRSWTVEPWNGKSRKSIRRRPAPSTGGPVPPLPGQESNAMTTVTEDDGSELATEECGERGRLFVKVMGVKDLDLPLPKNERTWFSLTLDNGVHCVTTAWLELARNAPIGQEFELVVPNDLEFQLTLNVKLEKPPLERAPMTPTRTTKPKASTFSRVFASPKKRKEMEARARAEEEAYAQAQRDAVSRQRKIAPTAWDLLSPLAAEDGSFARAYVCLKEHESRCYGRPYMAEIAAFNEWATEEPNFASSVKSKRTDMSSSVMRRAPYKIGKLEVQLLFVPRPKGATDDDMPKSMNSCIRELKAAEERLSRNWEGHLSQQGGDCPYWRRRYFKLVGTKLTAYHETTRQPRATINLSNAKRLIDDRRQLTNPETTGRGGKRRRSAFAEDEEGYMFVEEGFRIRFNNGEVIDFYADTPEDKEGWMQVLGDVIGRPGGDGAGTGDDDGAAGRRKWCDLVLKREEALRKRAEGRRTHSRTKSSVT
ncbi:hypothetical protein DL770_001223 [Monosporascus sp. CRB-9-2]|nr:hypothetical protein DL770_001223 [Monosporascus sp. CRB-9-2]